MTHRIIRRQHNLATDLFRAATCLTGLTADFEVDRASVLTVSGHCDLVHRNLVNGPVGYSTRLSLVRADSLNDLGPQPLWNTPPGVVIPGSINGANIRDIVDHYGKTALNGHAELEPGAYRLMVHGVSHSSLAPNTDGLIEVLVENGKGLNVLIARIDPA